MITLVYLCYLQFSDSLITSLYGDPAETPTTFCSHFNDLIPLTALLNPNILVHFNLPIYIYAHVLNTIKYK